MLVGQSSGKRLATGVGMKEMLQKIIVILLIVLSAHMHPEKQIIACIYHFAFNHSETVRAAAQLIHILRSF